MAKHIVSMFVLLLLISPVIAQDNLDNLVPITADNLTRLESLGYFTSLSEEDVLRLDWLPGSDDIFVVYDPYYGSDGVWLYEANNPDTAPRFLEGNRIFFSPDGSLYAIRSMNDEEAVTQLFDVATGDLIRTLSHGNVLLPDDYNALDFSPDGTLLASAWDQTILLWDIATGEQRLNVSADYGWVTSVNFNADGTLMVAATDPGEVSVWDVTTGERLAKRNDHFNVTYASFSPTDNLILSSSIDRSLTLWDAYDPENRLFIDAHTDVNYGKFTPDGSRLIVGDATYSERSLSLLRIFDIEKRTEIVERQLEDMSICDRCPGEIALSSSGDTLAFWTRNSKILLIDPISGEQLHSLEGGTAWVTGAAFNPDGNLFTSWDEANELRFWNVATGEHLVTLDTDPIVDLIFSHDGTRLISAHTDGTVQLWGIPAD